MVDELPQSAAMTFNGTEGQFEYTIENREGHIRLQCKLLLGKAIFLPATYQDLRNFYGAVLKKESEMIVFKKMSKK